jgi:hypothetical protein
MEASISPNLCKLPRRATLSGEKRSARQLHLPHGDDGKSRTSAYFRSHLGRADLAREPASSLPFPSGRERRVGEPCVRVERQKGEGSA